MTSPLLDNDWMARRTVGFQNNEKMMEHSDHWIMTGWHRELWDFKTMKR